MTTFVIRGTEKNDTLSVDIDGEETLVGTYPQTDEGQRDLVLAVKVLSSLPHRQNGSVEVVDLRRGDTDDYAENQRFTVDEWAETL